ncbi:hypothetical protein evm_011583 [Chilo suppressalis]|nr:hypothetical protein evm_011583 [Chilo suppressalis]
MNKALIVLALVALFALTSAKPRVDVSGNPEPNSGVNVVDGNQQVNVVDGGEQVDFVDGGVETRGGGSRK